MGVAQCSSWRFLTAGLLTAATLAGCANYAPAPLSEPANSVLAAPDLRARSVGPARPSNIDLAAPLTPRTLGLIAVVASPELKAARAQARVADAQLFNAGLLPDPSFNFAFDKLLSGPDTANGLSAQIVYDLMAFRDRGVVRAAARAARAQARDDVAWREWQTAGQARLLATRIAALEASAALQARVHDETSAALGRALAAAARGDARADDITARRLAEVDAADRTAQGERDLAAARHDLNRLLGLAPESRLKIVPDRVLDLSLDANALFLRARVGRLDLKALEAGYLSQEAVVRKAVWDAFPTLQLTVARARDTAANQTIGPAVSFTPPLWTRNAGGVALARATREQLRAEYAARLFATRAEIAGLVSGLSADRRRRDDLAAQVGPWSRMAAKAAAAAEAGDISHAAAEAVRQGAADRQLALMALDQSVAEQSVGLEIAVGGSLDDLADTGRAP